MTRRPPAPIPWPFYVVWAANFLFFLNFAFFFLLPLWILARGGGEETVGRVVGVSGLAGLVVLPLIGYLLDRFGRRRFMISGALIAALASAGFIFVDEIGPSLYALRIIQGVAFTCAFTGAQTLAVLFAPPDRRAAAIGWFGISTILTHAISPLVGEEIITRWGFDAMFAIGAGLGMIAFVLSCLLPQPPELRGPATRHGVDPGLARRAVATASLAMVCYGFGFGATQTFVPVMMERFDLGRVGTFFLSWSVAAVTMRILLGGASDRFGRRAVILPAMATMSLAVLMLTTLRTLPGMIAVGLTFGMAQGLLYPTMNALVADWSSPHNIGRVQSLFSGSYSLGIAGCSFFFGTIAENHGFSIMFWITFAITLIGLAIFLAGPKEEIARESALADAAAALDEAESVDEDVDGGYQEAKKSSTSVLSTPTLSSRPSR